MARDSTDRIIEEWARIRREIVGIKHPLLSSEYLGPMKCTLGQRRDLHAGAKSNGVEQQWPEFPYQGESALVNWLFWKSSPTFKEIMDWHWVLIVPRNKNTRAELMGLSRRVYWERVAKVKSYVEGGLVLFESVRTVLPNPGAINTMPKVATGH